MIELPYGVRWAANGTWRRWVAEAPAGPFDRFSYVSYWDNPVLAAEAACNARERVGACHKGWTKARIFDLMELGTEPMTLEQFNDRRDD